MSGVQEREWFPSLFSEENMKICPCEYASKDRANPFSECMLLICKTEKFLRKLAKSKQALLLCVNNINKQIL